MSTGKFFAWGFAAVAAVTLLQALTVAGVGDIMTPFGVPLGKAVMVVAVPAWLYLVWKVVC